MKKEIKDYEVIQTLAAGSDSTYCIFDKEGNKSVYGFSSKSEAREHLEASVNHGVDPLSL